MDTCREGRVARPAVDSVRALHIDVGNRRMVANLLKQYCCTICHLALHGFTEDGVEGLVEDVAGLEEGE